MEEKKDVLILGIESSCDETAASVVKNGRTDRKSTRLNSSHASKSRMPSSA